MNESSWFWFGSFLPPVLHCVKRKFGYLQKHEHLPLKLCPKLQTKKIWPQHINLWNVSSILARQGGRSERDKLDRRRSTKLTILRAPTLDRCSLSQWSSSSVYSTIPLHGSVSDSWYLFKHAEYRSCQPTKGAKALKGTLGPDLQNVLQFIIRLS